MTPERAYTGTDRRNCPLRRVVKRVFVTNRYCRHGEGCIVHTLECGHDVVAKQSCGEPARKRCFECVRKGAHLPVGEERVQK